MSPRLNIVEELKIEYEVPFVSKKGEVIDHTAIQVNENRQGMALSYAMLDATEEKVKNLFPEEGVDNLAGMVKDILNGLGMQPEKTILQLWEFTAGVQLYSVEGRAPVNKQRDSVLIIITKTPFIYKYGYEMVLWHQAMHAKDRWERRFPSAHPMVHVGDWMDSLWHFSIDGRLQNLGKPHYSKEERLDEAIRAFRQVSQAEPVEELVHGLCGQLWGNQVTMTELLEIGNRLGVGPAARR